MASRIHTSLDIFPFYFPSAPFPPLPPPLKSASLYMIYFSLCRNCHYWFLFFSVYLQIMKFSLESEHTTLKHKLLRYFKKNSSSHHRQSSTQQDSRIDEGFHQQKSNNTSCPSLITTSTCLSAASSSASTTDQIKKIGRTRNSFA